MEAINNVGAAMKKRGVPSEMIVGARSTETPSLPTNVIAAIDSVVAPSVGDAQPANNSESGRSGVNYIMGEDDLEDVDGFIRNKEDPVAKSSEAELIVQIQSELGVIIVDDVQNLVENLMMLEDRDREELNKHLETNCSQ
jgi:hypothetical protein